MEHPVHGKNHEQAATCCPSVRASCVPNLPITGCVPRNHMHDNLTGRSKSRRFNKREDRNTSGNGPSPSFCIQVCFNTVETGVTVAEAVAAFHIG